MGRRTARVPSTRLDVDTGAVVRRPDTVAVEEPLEIRVGGESLTTTMRTPGDDFDLTLGHLVTEGLLRDGSEVRGLMHCTDTDADGSPTFNVVDVTLAPGAALHGRPRARAESMTSACGICGTATIDAIRTAARYAVAEDATPLAADVLASLPQRLRARQPTFDRTGGVHAAALFTPGGGLLAVREDVGRHNAVDKVVGWAVREDRLPLSGTVLVVSARASFEIVQKAVMAGIPAVVAVSAPSSLAVGLATETGLTLVAFARAPRLVVYAGEHRLGG
jgi:FdhD protein